MRVVVTVHDLGFGGTQTYALTVTEQLQRLGHEATIHSGGPGPLAEVARSRGLPLALTEDELPPELDALLTQDGDMAYRMAERFPSVPQLFRCPSDLFDLQLPPQLPGIVGASMAVSDRCAERLRAIAADREVIRLRQPIDTERFVARNAIRDTPRRAVVLGTYLRDARMEMLQTAWESAGVEIVRLDTAPEPEAAIADADIVVAKGKAAIEGMACARAVFVYDQFGCDGWVTPESYPALEADNFAGLATDQVPSPRSLRAALDQYDPAMGMANRDLATRHHSARHHAHAVVEILRDLAPGAPPPDSPLRELARLVRAQWATEMRAYHLGTENTALHRRLIETEAKLDAVVERAEHAERRLATLKATRRYRAAAALGRAADALRGRR
jgi:hypothetical protein